MERGLWRDTSEAELLILAECLDRYRDEVVPTKKGGRRELDYVNQWKGRVPTRSGCTWPRFPICSKWPGLSGAWSPSIILWNMSASPSCRKVGIDGWLVMRNPACGKPAAPSIPNLSLSSSLLWHKTLQTLKRYTHLRAEDLAKLLG